MHATCEDARARREAVDEDNGMHLTADTLDVIFQQGVDAAGSAGR